ncbi:MAG: hypothetical protein JWO60_2547 [Frankiales bacterium]|nr:hypothetical protein [Frankiales bacterium]
MSSVALRSAPVQAATRPTVPLPAAGTVASQPWAPGDALRLLVLQVAGAFTVLGAWVGTAGSSRLSHQFAWTSLGVVGFLLAAVGTAAWLLTGRRAVGLRLARLLSECAVTRDSYGRSAPARLADEPSSVRVAPPSSDGLVAVEGAGRYHRPGCVLVRGKDVLSQAREDHLDAGRRACELCTPEQEAAA